MIRPLDVDKLRAEFTAAQPYRYLTVDGFLDQAAVEELAVSYPTFESAVRMGLTFKTVNEQKKVQVTDAALFPAPVRRLNDALASPDFLARLSDITGIPDLLADDQLEGGGMHVTGAGGRLDVHVDFNYLEQRRLHRRLNLLLYLNPEWQESWGGHIELWDPAVKTCGHRSQPTLNRCLIFETSEISFHGVAPVSCPPGIERRSFACYFYTREAPPGWRGVAHSTVFKARPNERLRGYVAMPAERVANGIVRQLRRAKRRLGTWLRGPAPRT